MSSATSLHVGKYVLSGRYYVLIFSIQYLRVRYIWKKNHDIKLDINDGSGEGVKRKSE